MSGDELKKAIAEALNVPVYDDGQSITFPSATLDIYLDTAELHGDGKGTGHVKSVKIDLWYKDAGSIAVAKGLLLNMLDSLPGCTTPDILSTFDTQARKYRATFTFEMI